MHTQSPAHTSARTWHRLMAASMLACASFAANASDAALAESYAANAAYGIRDLATAAGYVNQAMALMSAAGNVPSSGGSVFCPAGGSATFSVTSSAASASSPPLPTYTVQFQDCALTPALVLQGGVVKAVTSKVTSPATAANGWTKTTTETALNQFNQLSVMLSYGSVLISGSSETKSQSTNNIATKASSNATQTLISTGNAITLTTSHTFNERSSSYALVEGTNVVYTTSGIAGVTNQVTLSGQANLSVSPYQLGQVGTVGPLNFVVAFTDSLTFDPAGIVNSGAFKLVTPVNNAYLAVAGGGQVTVCFDKANDGAVEACWGPVPASRMAP